MKRKDGKGCWRREGKTEEQKQREEKEQEGTKEARNDTIRQKVKKQ